MAHAPAPHLFCVELAVVVREAELVIFLVMAHNDLALVQLAERVVARLADLALAVVVAPCVGDPISSSCRCCGARTHGSSWRSWPWSRTPS